MKYPYVISSDQHCHDWSAFSSVGIDGVNTRLNTILEEIVRSYVALGDAGGTHIFLAGDLFHQRGQIKPSVFNPTYNKFKLMADLYPGIETYAIPGNHDLEGKDASVLGNAMQALSQISTFNSCVEPTEVGDVVVFPWYQNLDDLRAALKSYADPTKDAIIHAPVNGVIKGIPDHGLEASELAAMGYRRVFSGHYHNHVVFEDGKVISVGATSHQTWSDPGTKAGFVLVYEDRIEHVPTNAPLFVDIDDAAIKQIDDAGESVETLVEGNYVRVRLNDLTDKERAGWKKDIEAAGARGCIVVGSSKPTAATVRSGAGNKAAVSLAASIEHYVRYDLKPLLADEVSKEAQEVLTEAMS